MHYRTVPSPWEEVRGQHIRNGECYITREKICNIEGGNKMRWPKEFERVSGQKVRLTGTKIYIYQWNTGKNKNFMIEQLGLSVHQQNTWTIPGKGDDAMKTAIEKAKSLI